MTPTVVPDPRVFRCAALYEDPEADGAPYGETRWYEDAKTGAGRMLEEQSLRFAAREVERALVGEITWNMR